MSSAMTEARHKLVRPEILPAFPAVPVRPVNRIIAHSNEIVSGRILLSNCGVHSTNHDDGQVRREEVLPWRCGFGVDGIA
jgi:hypothetical protein